MSRFPSPSMPTISTDEEYVASVKAHMSILMVVLPMSAMLVPTLIQLYSFSTPASRRHHVFYLNIISILLGLLMAILLGYDSYKSLAFPFGTLPNSFFITQSIIAILSPIFVDSILIARIFAFYPAKRRSWAILSLTLLPTMAAKAVRFALAVVYIANLVRTTNNTGTTGTEAEILIWPHNVPLITQWGVQMVDNFYCSALFLYKLHNFYRGKTDFSAYRSASLLARLRQLFFIALSNFVFPLILNICQTVLNLTDRSFVRGIQVYYAKVYLHIFMVVFATVWASGSAWGRRAEWEPQGPAFANALCGRSVYLPSDEVEEDPEKRMSHPWRKRGTVVSQAERTFAHRNSHRPVCIV